MVLQILSSPMVESSPDFENTSRTIPLISAASGLIGTPQVGEQGFVTLTSQIQPNLTPGYSFRLESRLITGFYRVEKATYRGDSWGSTWAVELEGKPL